MLRKDWEEADWSGLDPGKQASCEVFYTHACSVQHYPVCSEHFLGKFTPEACGQAESCIQVSQIPAYPVSVLCADRSFLLGKLQIHLLNHNKWIYHSRLLPEHIWKSNLAGPCKPPGLVSLIMKLWLARWARLRVPGGRACAQPFAPEPLAPELACVEPVGSCQGWKTPSWGA